MGGRLVVCPFISIDMVIRKRLNIKGPAIVFITTTVFKWKPVLIYPSVTNILLNELKTATSLYQVSILSYVIMPSHIHALFGFKEIEKLSKFMLSFKRITSKSVKKLQLNELIENDFKLWKPRFDDLIITSQKQFDIKMQYIHTNPLRAELVTNPADWQLSSAQDWLTSKTGFLPIDKEFTFF